jgi:hypothetical protein
MNRPGLEVPHRPALSHTGPGERHEQSGDSAGNQAFVVNRYLHPVARNGYRRRRNPATLSQGLLGLQRGGGNASDVHSVA